MQARVIVGGADSVGATVGGIRGNPLGKRSLLRREPRHLAPVVTQGLREGAQALREEAHGGIGEVIRRESIRALAKLHRGRLA